MWIRDTFAQGVSDCISKGKFKGKTPFGFHIGTGSKFALCETRWIHCIYEQKRTVTCTVISPGFVIGSCGKVIHFSFNSTPCETFHIKIRTPLIITHHGLYISTFLSYAGHYNHMPHAQNEDIIYNYKMKISYN